MCSVLNSFEANVTCLELTSIIQVSFFGGNDMRRDNRPYWVKKAFDWLNDAFIHHFIRPQLEGAGVDLRVHGVRHLQISGPNISAGDHVHMMALPDKPIRLAVYEGLGRIDIGSYSIVNPGVRVTSASEIIIGQSCMLAMNAYLSDADWHDLQHRIYAPGATAGIKLDDNVWIGDSALVCKGVHIGENSVVGAWSVVTKDVPANVVVAGVPAKIVRALDPEEITTRKHLFTGEVPYADFEASYFQEKLGNNGLINWIRSLSLPGNKD